MGKSKKLKTSKSSSSIASNKSKKHDKLPACGKAQCINCDYCNRKPTTDEKNQNKSEKIKKNRNDKSDKKKKSHHSDTSLSNKSDQKSSDISVSSNEQSICIHIHVDGPEWQLAKKHNPGNKQAVLNVHPEDLIKMQQSKAGQSKTDSSRKDKHKDDISMDGNVPITEETYNQWQPQAGYQCNCCNNNNAQCGGYHSCTNYTRWCPQNCNNIQ